MLIFQIVVIVAMLGGSLAYYLYIYNAEAKIKSRVYAMCLLHSGHLVNLSERDYYAVYNFIVNYSLDSQNVSLKDCALVECIIKCQRYGS